MNNTFTIVIPAFNRANSIVRSLISLVHQTYRNFEIIVVDDGSSDNTGEIANDYLSGKFHDYKVIKFKENLGRLAARNEGMMLASNDWICWLDSDDEYVSTYLETLNNAINQFQEYKIFNYGAFVLDEPNFRSWLRDTFLPPLRADGRGHDGFKSGGIGSGSFCFKRELIAEVGLLPEAATPYGDDNSLPARATKAHPEIESLYGRTESGQWKPFGNPWGDDWLYFYLLTRNNISKPLNVHLYVQHVRH